MEYAIGGTLSEMTIGAVTLSSDVNLDGRVELLRRGNELLIDPEYSGPGDASVVGYSNGIVLSRQYDGRGRREADDFGLIRFDYGYGQDGRQRLLVTTPEGESSNVQMLALDGVGRVSGDLTYEGPFTVPAPGTLNNESYSALVGQADSAQAFSYNTSNNITLKTNSSGSEWQPNADQYNRHAAAPNGEMIEYDEDGRVVFDGTHSITYNAWGLPGRIDGPEGECTYEYDAFNRRATETCDGTTASFSYFENILVGTRTSGTETGFCGGATPLRCDRRPHHRPPR